MEKIIKSAYDALKNDNQYAALIVALIIPDICAALENGETTGSKYASWFENNLPEYKGYLSGKDCYALRCAILHQGKDDVSGQRIKEVLDYVIFMEPQVPVHLILGKNVVLNDQLKKSFLQLNVSMFIVDICKAAEKWLKTASGNKEIQRRLRETIEIHKEGYIHHGVMKFG